MINQNKLHLVYSREVLSKKSDDHDIEKGTYRQILKCFEVLTFVKFVIHIKYQKHHSMKNLGELG